jgi:hypothetical protein
MDIWVQDQNYFAWQFSDRERKLPEAAEFIAAVKKEFEHGKEWFYFREDHRWLIHKLKFPLFMEIYYKFIKDIVFKQNEMEFDGSGY